MLIGRDIRFLLKRRCIVNYILIRAMNKGFKIQIEKAVKLQVKGFSSLSAIITIIDLVSSRSLAKSSFTCTSCQVDLLL